MNMHTNSALSLPTEVADLCDTLMVPVTITTPDHPDMPIAYFNRAFERLTGLRRDIMLDVPNKILDGPLTDMALSDALRLCTLQLEPAAACLIHYRDDGNAFVDLTAQQSFDLPTGKSMTLRCHAAFNPLMDGDDMVEVASDLDQVWRSFRLNRGLNTGLLTQNEVLRLEAISMRMEAVFIRIQNALIKHASAGSIAYLRYSAAIPSYVSDAPTETCAPTGAPFFASDDH